LRIQRLNGPQRNSLTRRPKVDLITNVSVSNTPTITSPPRWRRRKHARPAEILDAALDCFAERGFAATRLDEVARRAGVTRGTLYLYFPSKEELFKAVVRQSIVPIIAERAQAIASSDAPAAETLSAFLLSIPAALRGSKIIAIPKIIISESQNFPDLARFYLTEVLGRGRRRVKGLIRRGIERGEFRDLNVDQVFFCVMAPIVMAMVWEHTFATFDKEMPELPALCRTHIDLLLHGLLRSKRK